MSKAIGKALKYIYTKTPKDPRKPKRLYGVLARKNLANFDRYNLTNEEESTVQIWCLSTMSS